MSACARFLEIPCVCGATLAIPAHSGVATRISACLTLGP